MRSGKKVVLCNQRIEEEPAGSEAAVSAEKRRVSVGGEQEPGHERTGGSMAQQRRLRRRSSGREGFPTGRPGGVGASRQLSRSS